MEQKVACVSHNGIQLASSFESQINHLLGERFSLIWKKMLFKHWGTMALSYIISENNALAKPHYGLSKIPVGADVSNRKKDDSRRQSGIVRRATDDCRVVLSRDQNTASQGHSLVPVDRLSGNDVLKNSLPATYMPPSEASGIREVGYSVDIHTHYLNRHWASGTTVTGIMGRAINKYKEAQAFSSRANSTFECKV
jgi:hypothetical protein